jgi:hypothetical protein
MMTQRKVGKGMSKTPIRLVAIDEEPPDEDVTQIQDFTVDGDLRPTPSPDAGLVQDAAPVRLSPEHEAITRRVPAVVDPAPAAAPITQQVQGWPKPTRTWKKYIPIAAAVVPLAGLLIAWLASRPARTPGGETAASPASRTPVSATNTPTPAPTATPHPTPVPVPPAQGQNAPAVIRLQITAEPVQAELGLDGNVLAGHRLNLEVPKDRGIHVVSASAPGYYPFNQQVSFSNDIVLHINLRRVPATGGRQASRQAAPARATAPVVNRAPAAAPPPVESKPQNTAKPHAPSRLEPGMDLDSPVPRRGPKSLDERNPYRP